MYNDQETSKLLLIFGMFGFFLWLGVFNVVSAIFVESTMEAASALHDHKRTERLNDEDLWSTNIATLINVLWKEAGNASCNLSMRVEEVAELEIPRACFKDCMEVPDAREALLNLDIGEEDHAHLDDILDPDQSGSISILEFMDGVARLRGLPRRSDVITVELILRSVQQSLKDLGGEVKRMGHRQLSSEGILPFSSEGTASCAAPT